MAKPLKIAAILIGVVVGLLVVAAVALTLLIDPNRYRDDIIRIVKEQTGRDLTIEGDLELSLFPWLGLETGKLVLSNAPDFGPEPFAVVASTETKVELWPLLRRQVVVDAVRLSGMQLHLARRGNGRTNWDDLTRGPAGPIGGAEPAPPPEKQPGAALALFTIERVELRDAQFTWRDEVAGAAYAARNLRLTSGDILGAEPAPVELAFDLESTVPRLRQRVVLDTRVRFAPEAETLDIPELRLALGDLQLRATLEGTGMLSAPKVVGDLEIPSFNPREVLPQFGVAYVPADPEVLRKVALTARLESDPKAVALTDLKLALDGTQLTGKAALQHDPALAYRFDILLDQIDVDRYLPAAADPADKKAEEKDNGLQAIAVPVGLLREANADGQVRIQKLKAFGIRSQEVAAKVTAREGRITFGPNSAKLYSGTYAGSTVIDVSTRTPVLQFNEKLTGVQLGPLLEDAGVFDRYSGTGNLDIKLTARGRDAAELTRTLNGTTAVRLRDGKIEGVNLQQLVVQARDMIGRIRGNEVEASTEPTDETAFKSLTATIRVKNGIARNDDLKLEGPVVRAQGSGSANLVEQTIDYQLRVTVAEGAAHAGTTVPVRIRGSFADLKYRVDLARLLREQTKPLERTLEKTLDKQIDRLRDRLRR